MFNFLTKDKNGEQSVSRTLLLISFILLVILGTLQVCGVVKDVGIFENLFWSTSGLYFGRKISLTKDTKELDKA